MLSNEGRGITDKELLSEKKAFVLLLLVLGIGFLYLLRPVFMPLMLAIIITILTYPIYKIIFKWCKERSYLASFITTLLIFLILVLPFSLMLALVMNETFTFVSHLNISENISLVASQEFYQSYILPAVRSFEQRFNMTLDIAGLTTKIGTQVARYIYNFSPQVLSQTLGFVFGFIIMQVSLYFLFIEGKNLLSILLDLSPVNKKYEDKLTSECKNMINATVYGYFLTALSQAILAGLGFWIAKVQSPLVFGTITFFMALVPFFGAATVWILLSVWYFIQGETVWGIFLVLYGFLIISGIDNFIKPIIMRGKAKIHILLIFFSLLGGMALFGPMGILFGPIITALFLACIRIYREDFVTRE